ncbi:MAG: hypothetical protein AAB721_03000 [Patescibacteria group bacterium]
MSTDYNAACYTCRREIHLGQRMADLGSFGFGIADHATIRRQWVWLLEHLQAGHDVRIVESEATALAEENGGGEAFTYDDVKDIVRPPETNPKAM